MVYLDSAATSFQKPKEVNAAVRCAMRSMSSPGRGGYPSTARAEQTLFRCRSAAAEYFGVAEASNVVFTMNATHALNIAIKTLVPPGGRAIISCCEHNAVTRPLRALGAEVRVASAPLFDSEELVRAFRRALRFGADVVICTHASNVFGWILPIGDIAALCREKGIPLIIDASQTAGIVPIDAASLGAAFIAMPGHKGLYGPQGTGLLLCGTLPTPLLEGGTGSESLRAEMPSFLPDRAEAGTHNMPGIAGLEQGICFVRRLGHRRILCHERALLAQAKHGLAKKKNVRLFAAPDAAQQLGVLAFTVTGREAEDIASRLAKNGFALRGGLHCAPLAHEQAGTLPDGALRLSVSVFNTPQEIEGFLCAMRRLF